ncbi:MAG TPA: acyltransferase [Pyrinomonadaceae bacterium]|nr:acyltransferase [Pyrinomonadaceae bacterium]
MNLTRMKAFNGGRLLSIDALRGIAALSVVLYHAVQQMPNPVPAGIFKWPSLVIQFFSSFGYAGVYLFFVISGFCIHLQWTKANAAGVNARIKFGDFWKRRIRRLYPPYLIALAAYLLFTALKSGIDVTRFFFYDVGMHLLMLHNLDSNVCYTINGVFWTLAVEEQLYLAYFLMLFLRIRWGWGPTLVVCLLSRIGWYLLAQFVATETGFGLPVAEAAAAHWFTWALGALSVEAFFGKLRLPNWCRNIWLGGALLVLGIAMSLFLPSLHNLVLHDLVWLFLHPVWGAGFFIVINRAVFAEQSWLRDFRKPMIVKGLALVGVISYSLYLTHELVVIQSWRFGAWGRFPMLNTLTLVVPATIAAAWLFFRFCERPYMRKAVTQPAKVRLREEVFVQVAEQAEA